MWARAVSEAVGRRRTTQITIYLEILGARWRDESRWPERYRRFPCVPVGFLLGEPISGTVVGVAWRRSVSTTVHPSPPSPLFGIPSLTNSVADETTAPLGCRNLRRKVPRPELGRSRFSRWSMRVGRRKAVFGSKESGWCIVRKGEGVLVLISQVGLTGRSRCGLFFFPLPTWSFTLSQGVPVSSNYRHSSPPSSCGRNSDIRGLLGLTILISRSGFGVIREPRDNCS